MRMRSSQAALACVVVLCLTVGAWAGLMASEVKEVIKTEDGKYVIKYTDTKGAYSTWDVIDDEQNGRPFFFSKLLQKAQWDDPREVDGLDASGSGQESGGGGGRGVGTPGGRESGYATG
jgi:hypothetical protein